MYSYAAKHTFESLFEFSDGVSRLGLFRLGFVCRGGIFPRVGTIRTRLGMFWIRVGGISSFPVGILPLDLGTNICVVREGFGRELGLGNFPCFLNCSPYPKSKSRVYDTLGSMVDVDVDDFVVGSVV